MSKIEFFNQCMRDVSTPSISHVCELSTEKNYSSCIRERLHLLDKCSHKILFDTFSSELSECGRIRINLGLYYIHVQKWLSVVPRDKFLYLSLEGVVQHPTETAYEIINFLGLTMSPDRTTTNHVMRSCDKNSQSVVDYKHERKLKMRNDTKVMLERFYAPFNSLLAEAVGSEQFLWR